MENNVGLPLPHSAPEASAWKLTAEERAWLLRMARDSATEALGGPPAPATPPLAPSLLRHGACFVTFKLRVAPDPGSGLRGCLGALSAKEPLWRCVARMAAETVTGDPRFLDNPITLAELPALHIEISVLYPRRALNDPQDFTLGEEGIEVEGRGEWEGYRGLYLPQVAPEWGFTKEQLLTSCCGHKAGLPEDAWRDPARCQVFAFRAEVFGETC